MTAVLGYFGIFRIMSLIFLECYKHTFYHTCSFLEKKNILGVTCILPVASAALVAS